MILMNKVHHRLNPEQQQLQILSFVLGKCACFFILKNTMEIQVLSPCSCISVIDKLKNNVK